MGTFITREVSVIIMETGQRQTEPHYQVQQNDKES